VRNQVNLQKPVYVISSSSVAGQKEKNGPFGTLFDLCGDDRFGKDTWEKAEAEMQRISVCLTLKKAGLTPGEIDVLFAGDLVNQCLSSSFGLKSFKIPFLGLYGACSTCAEGMLLSALTCSSYYNRVLSATSSHYCSAERQFRSPLEYGGQRPQTAQWTVTGAGSFLYSSLSDDLFRVATPFVPEITDVLPGRIIDRGLNDANNMGAAMAPAAVDTLVRYFREGHAPSEYDAIITGDLGFEGSAILYDLLHAQGYSIEKNHLDCGNLIYHPKNDDVHAGGSGCGCSAVLMASKFFADIASGKLNNILFLATGALMNSLSVNQGQTIPAIAHLIHIIGKDKKEIIG